MNGIVTVSLDLASAEEATRTRLEASLADLGLSNALPATEGGSLLLPAGTFGVVTTIANMMDSLRHYYRCLVDAMRDAGFKGRYFVNVAPESAFVCGCL